MSGKGKCPDCDGGFVAGDGKCAQCHGSGINTQLDSAQPKCPYCQGSGVCRTCDGTGENRFPDEAIQRLFF